MMRQNPERIARVRKHGRLRVIWLALFLAGAWGPGIGAAQQDTVPIITFEDLPEFRYLEVVRALDEAGYRIVSITDTFLNRIRIRASNADHLREVIISRSSGQVLRDALIEVYQ